MSVTYAVKVGLYIEAPNPLRNGTKDVDACVNKTCAKFGKETIFAYCSDCGKKTEIVSLPCCERIRFDTYSEFDNRLYRLSSDSLPKHKKDTIIFLPNSGGFSHSFGDWEPAVMELNETVMLNDTTRFKSGFAREIERIQHVFGKAEVKWGVVAYCS